MRIGILTSGGDAPGMNSALRAVVRCGIYHEHRIFGIFDGYQGLIEGKIKEMNASSVADIIQRGGTILRTSRSETFLTKDGREKAVMMAREFEIDGMVIIGGDGSGRGALDLQRLGMPVALIPATIDNDMGYTDYSLGFMTALENIADAISKIRDTSGSHGRANVIEVMGRNCGDLALYAGLAGGAESSIIPEKKIELDKIANTIEHGKKRGKKHHIIALAEGVGNAYEIAEYLQEKTGVDTKVSVLGYIQRGGTPSVFDRVLGAKMGQKAVQVLVNGEKKSAIGTVNGEIISMDLEEALNVPKKINEDLLQLVEELSI